MKAFFPEPVLRAEKMPNGFGGPTPCGKARDGRRRGFQRGPRRQAFVAGVELQTPHDANKTGAGFSPGEKTPRVFPETRPLSPARLAPEQCRTPIECRLRDSL